MRKSGWTPSIVPNGDDQNVYIVVDDFGRNGRAYRETDVERADLEAVIMDMLEGQYQNPVRVVGFTTAEKWSEDVSGDVAMSCAAAAIYSFGTFRFIWKISSNGTKDDTMIFSYRFRYAWCEPCRTPAKAASRWPQSRLSRLHRASAGELDHQGAERRALDSRDQVRRLPGAGSH
jgi:hypothetical protein